MKIREMLRRMTIRDAWAYITGKLRYTLYNSQLRFLLPLNICLQYEFRLKIMRSKCYKQGCCEVCGCDVPDLQMAARSCEGNCYPPFMKPAQFSMFLAGGSVEVKGHKWKMEFEFHTIPAEVRIFKDDEKVHVREIFVEEDGSVSA